MSLMHKTHVIYDEHITLQHLEERGIPAYDTLKQCEITEIPEVLEFFTIVVNYLKMSEKLKEC